MKGFLHSIVRKRSDAALETELDAVAGSGAVFKAVRGEYGQTADPSAGTRERGSAPCRGVPVAGEYLPKTIYPLVRELAGDEMPVTLTCRVLKIARLPHYRWLTEPVSDAEVVAAYRANA